MSDTSLQGRVALVTGSTSGIGLGIAEGLAAAGAAVMLNGFGDPAAVEALRRRLHERHRVAVAYHPADVRLPQQVRELVATTVESLGSLDILVNNAGIQFVCPLETFPDERWDAIMATNLSAAFYATKAALPIMRARGWGRIINVASVHGLVASSHKAAYVAAKHGLVGLTKVAAIETANDGITVNAICPGWVLTPLVQEQLEARAAQRSTDVEHEKRALLEEAQPMLQFSTPQQVAALAQFLCSDHARSLTGAALPIDGGWVAH